MKHILLIISILLTSKSFSQDGVLIGTKPGNLAHSSAELEVYSTNKGVLLPSIASPSTSITAPATGLMVYNSTTNRLTYYDGTGWIELPYFTTILDNDDDTQISVERNNNDNDSIYFINKGYTTAAMTSEGLNMYSPNAWLGNNGGDKIFATPRHNTNIGLGAGASLTSGNQNTNLGADAGKIQTTTSFNTFAGADAGKSNTGNNNTFIGLSAGTSNTGSNNTFVGQKAGFGNTSGIKNVAIGSQAAYTNTTGSNNVLIGKNAGYDLFAAGSSTITGSNNIIIGNNAVLPTDQSNSLQIGKLITTNSTGNIIFNNQYIFPKVSSIDGYTLMLNADNKTLRWEDAGISRVDQTVVASAANLYTFDIGVRNGDYTGLQRQVFFVPLTAGASTKVSSVMVWIKSCYTGKLQTAIYDGITHARLDTSLNTAFTIASGKPDFVSVALKDTIALTKDQTYLIGIRAEGTCNFDFAKNNNTKGNIIYLSYYDKGTSGYAPKCDPADVTGQSTNKIQTRFGNISDIDNIPTQSTTPATPNIGINQCTTNDYLPWVRLY